MPPSFNLDEIPSLSKTNASKQLTAAVRQSQGTTRACYKDIERPHWWAPNSQVVLSNGSVETVPTFANPRELFLPEIRAALHLWYCSNLGVSPKNSPGKSLPDDTAPSKEESGSAVNDKSILEPEQQFDDQDSSPAAPILPCEPPRRRAARKEKASKEEPSFVDCTSPQPPKKTVRTKKRPVKSDALRKRPPRVAAKNSRRAPDPVDDDEKEKRYDTTMKYIATLEANLNSLRAEAEEELDLQKQSADAIVSNLRCDVETQIRSLKNKYNLAVMSLPPELMDMSVADCMDKYNLDPDIWLLDDISKVVKTIIGNRGDNNIADEGKNQGDMDDSSEVAASVGTPPARTPPARTRAARKRREDVLDTVRKTKRRVRLAAEEHLTSNKTTAAENELPSAGIGLGSRRLLRSDFGDPTGAMSAIRPKRTGEVVYSMNGTPVQLLHSPKGQPATPASKDPISAQIHEVLTATDITRTVRQHPNPKKFIADMRRQLDAAEVELGI